MTFALRLRYLRNVESDALLLEALDEVPMYLCIVEGPEFHVIAVNRKVRESPHSSLGKRLSDYYPGNTPLRQALERVYASGVAETLHELPTYFPDRTNSRFFTRTFIPLQAGPGGMKRILFCAYEVTEAVEARAREHRSQAELQRLFTVLEEVPSFLSVLEGPELRVAMTNRRMREKFGDRDLIGTSLADLVPPDNATLGAARRVYATGVPETLDVVARDIEGFEGRSFSTTIAPIREPYGTISRVVSASLETTEQLRAREALEAQARDLELARRAAVESGQVKDEFLAMLGHELRNPLTPMSVAVQVMKMQGASSPMLEILERQMNHLIRLVDDLLDISRITRGVVSLKRSEIELVNIVNRALETTSPLLEERGHRVILDIVHRGLCVLADVDRLAQVISNLVTNAAKYSEPGSRIWIKGRREGDRVKLSVADEGVGITPEMLPKVFDAFVQQPQTLDRSQGGLGLGLAIVKSLVDSHGGTTSVQSDGPGHGSTFVVDLPAVEAQPSAAADSQPMPVAAEWTSPAPIRVLVVDDNRDVVEALRIVFAARGHAIAFANDGPSALEVAANHHPQVALIDIGLPIIDGYQLAELLRASHNIPIVAITGYGQEADRQRSDAAGFAAHLVKPVDIGELVRLVERLAAPHAQAS